MSSISITHFDRLKQIQLTPAEAQIANQLWFVANHFEWFEYYPFRINSLSLYAIQHSSASLSTPYRLRLIVIDVISRYIKQNSDKDLKLFIKELEDVIIVEDLSLDESKKYKYKFFPTAWNGTWQDIFYTKFPKKGAVT